MKRSTLGLALLALVPLAPPAPAGAQEALILEVDRGWIGISYDVTLRRGADTDAAAGARVVVLNRVYEGSPAAEAGLEAGDTLLTVNGAPASEEVFRNLELEPGDRVRMTLRRNGETREVSLTAGERPKSVGLFRVSPSERLRIDSVRTAIVRFMEDSARVSLQAVPFRFRVGEQMVEGGEGRIHFMVHGDSARAWTLEADSLGTMLRGEGPGFNWFRYESGETSFPFSAFVAHSESTDSILEEMRELRSELERARRAELQRQRELAQSLAEEQRRIDRSDRELQRTRELQAELRARLARTQELLERESRKALLTRVAPDSIRADTISVASSFRIPAPHVVGRTVVAGAQLLPLNQGLGEYFGTDEGVLVTEVVPGSPADSADIQPGDVLVAVGGEPVRSVAEVRRSLSHPLAWPADLTLLRKRERLTVKLRR